MYKREIDAEEFPSDNETGEEGRGIETLNETIKHKDFKWEKQKTKGRETLLHTSRH